MTPEQACKTPAYSKYHLYVLIEGFFKVTLKYFIIEAFLFFIATDSVGFCLLELNFLN